MNLHRSKRKLLVILITF